MAERKRYAIPSSASKGQSIAVVALVLTIVCFSLLFVVPVFPWGRHAELETSIGALRTNSSQLQQNVTLLENVIQMVQEQSGGAKRDSVPDAPVSLDSAGVSAYVNAAAYYQNGHRLGLHDLRDVDVSQVPAPASILSWNGSHFGVAPAPITTSVNGESGTVTLTTDDVPEGALNKYFRLDESGYVPSQYLPPASGFHVSTADPNATFDSTAGYTVGAQLVNSANGGVWQCVDDAVAAAVWRRLDLFPQAVGSAQLANGAVQTQHYEASSVDTSALDDASVTAAKLTTNAVLLPNMAADSVDGTKVVDGSLSGADIALNSVQGSRIVDASIATAKLVDGAISAYKLGAGAVAGGEGGVVADGTIDAHDVDVTSVQVRVLGTCPQGSQVASINAAGGVECDASIVVPAGSITGTQLAAASVDGTHVAAASITSAHIANGAVTQLKLSAAYARGAANGVTPLGADAKIPTAYLPDLSITSVVVVADVAARDALDAGAGDVAIVEDAGPPSNSRESFMYTGAAWEQLSDGSHVSDVAGKTGSVTLSTDDVEEGATRLYYSEARVTANAAVAASTAHASLAVGNPHSVTKADVGLGNVLNVLHKFDATTQPSATDDVNAGYAVGSRYINTATGNVWVATDVTAGAAVWKSLDLYTGAVTTSILADASVTQDKLQDAAVVSAKIASGAVIASHMSVNAVGVDALQSASVTGGKIANGAVQTAHVADNAITAAKITPAAVDTAQLATGSVTNAKLGVGAVSTTSVLDGTLLAADFDATFLASLGNVDGPAGAVTDNTLARWDGITGRALQGSSITVSDGGLLNGRDIAADGATLDAHIGDADTHRVIADGSVSATSLWSSTKVTSELSGKANTAHTHSAGDVSDFTNEVDARITAQKAQPNGLATLDGNGKVPASQLTLDGANVYQATWDASTNTPSIVSGVGTKGHYWVVNVAGTTLIDGISEWNVGDWIIYNGVAYEKLDHTSPISSVQGRTGAVVISASDLTTGTLPNTAVSSANVLQHEALISHAALIGGAATYSHAALDAHVDDATQHRVINDGATSTTSLWSSDKVSTLLAGKSDSSHTHSDIIGDARISESSVVQHEAALTLTPAQSGLGNVPNVKQNLAATTAPTANDDSGSGYAVGSRWLDTLAGKEYVCVDASVAAAVWVATTTLTGTGDVSGPGGATTDNGVVRWDGTSGQVVQDSAVQITDAGNIVLAGTVDGRDVSVDGGVLDAHVADAAAHRSINDSASGATDLWSAAKISTELASHTHAAADVVDFATEVDVRITAQRAQPNGLASLDGSGKVPASQLSIDGGLVYQETWDAR